MVLLELFWLVGAILGAIRWGFALFFLILNFGVLLLFGYDKRASIKNLPRIPERELLFWTVCGGSAGAMVGILLFRHKSAKWSIAGWVILVFVVHCILLALLV